MLSSQRFLKLLELSLDLLDTGQNSINIERRMKHRIHRIRVERNQTSDFSPRIFDWLSASC